MQGLQKANVIAGRFNVRNEIRIFLYTSCYVVKGEKLVYDYNGLVEEQYPTSNFV